ncbi:MAG: histidine phosphatase family protein [Marmoricola sp.]
MKRLVVLRHAKSDWTQPVSDRQRPITSRGARQASEAGEWLAAQPWQIDLALVSPAVRASSAWDLAAAHLDAVPTQRVEDAYTFDGDALLALVRRQPADLTTIVVVSHNPAVEELVEALTGRWVLMKTSSLAVVELDSWQSRSGELVAWGRPPE